MKEKDQTDVKFNRRKAITIAAASLGASVILAYPLLSSLMLSKEPEKKPSEPKVYLYNPKKLLDIKENGENDPLYKEAVQNLTRLAEKYKDEDIPSVTSKIQTPPSGDKHDYMSLSPYQWPNPKTADGLPYIGKDGQVNPEIHTVPDKDNFDKLTNIVTTLALASYLTDNEAYVKAAIKDIRFWFLNPSSKMNPNLKYAQSVKGKNEGAPSGFIDMFKMPEIIDALGLLKQSDLWTDQDETGMQTWFSEYFRWLRESGQGMAVNESDNNIGTWYDVQLIDIALYTNQTNEAKNILMENIPKRITKAIEPDGRQSFELVRTRAWDYSTFNVSALCQMALLGEHVGVDLWHYQTNDGRSIRMAVQFLIPYAVNEQLWPYQQITGFTPSALYVPLIQTATALNDSGLFEQSQKIAPKGAKTNIRSLILY